MAGPDLQRGAERARRRADRRPPPELPARRTASACVITANEVRQLMASGTVDGTPQADDVNFATQPRARRAAGAARAGCTDPNRLLRAHVDANRPVLARWSPRRSATRRARGYDQFYGYGRVNMVERRRRGRRRRRSRPRSRSPRPTGTRRSTPARPALDVRGAGRTRAARAYTCRVLRGARLRSPTTDDDRPAAGDFEQVVARPGATARRTPPRSTGRWRASRRRDPEGAVPGDGERLRRPGVRPGHPQTSTAGRTPSRTASP